MIFSGNIQRSNFKCLCNIFIKHLQLRYQHVATKPSHQASFGFFFDIDGVFTRGKTVLPEAQEAFQYLVDARGRWRVPAVFVTNAGNTLKQTKAEKLSDMFKAKVHPNQVVMSHSPLSMFTQFHHRNVLVVGQGPVKTIAKNLGFTKIVTMEDMVNYYPNLDVCDHNRRRAAPCAFERYNKRIEAIVLFGEPTKWETSLQILLDVLLTDGQPYAESEDLQTTPRRLTTFSDLAGDEEHPSVTHPRRPYPHMPLIACNMDLLWMAEAPLPRLAHGSFLLCLESLYEKLSGRRLLYTALVGKPSEITYHHAEYRLNQMAYDMLGMNRPLSTIYCIGDNPHTDIYGANLYNQYLTNKHATRKGKGQKKTYLFDKASGSSVSLPARNENIPNIKEAARIRSDRGDSSPVVWGAAEAASCRSVLVLTGVFQKRTELKLEEIAGVLAGLTGEDGQINHNHRDFPDCSELKRPHFVAENIRDAIKDIYKYEHFDL